MGSFAMTDNLKEKFMLALEEHADKPLQFDLINLKKPFLITIIFCIIMAGFIHITSSSTPGPSTNPMGKIRSPVAGSETGKEVNIVGETKNIGVGQYVWLAIDKPDLGLCWPKMHVLGNTKFSTNILEEGPKEAYRLSLYVLNEIFHKQWKEWQDRKIFGGVHMPPESKRLDQVTLLLKY